MFSLDLFKELSLPLLHPITLDDTSVVTLTKCVTQTVWQRTFAPRLRPPRRSLHLLLFLFDLLLLTLPTITLHLSTLLLSLSLVRLPLLRLTLTTITNLTITSLCRKFNYSLLTLPFQLLAASRSAALRRPLIRSNNQRCRSFVPDASFYRVEERLLDRISNAWSHKTIWLWIVCLLCNQLHLCDNNKHREAKAIAFPESLHLNIIAITKLSQSERLVISILTFSADDCNCIANHLLTDRDWRHTH
jgi:hypothetical protein